MHRYSSVETRIKRSAFTAVSGLSQPAALKNNRRPHVRTDAQAIFRFLRLRATRHRFLSQISKGCSTSSCVSLFRRLGAFLEFEPTNIATADHALIVDCVSADDFGHKGEIEVADFPIALGETMKHTICRLYRGQFLICWVDRSRLIA